MEWGTAGAVAVATGADFAVVVDVLSFTTTLCVAVAAGIEVFPSQWQGAAAAELARRHDATLALSRVEASLAAAGSSPAAGSMPDHPAGSSDPQADGLMPLVSLSPASIAAAHGLARLVLPSPNGSQISAGLADGGAQVLGACLRNRTAVASWLAGRLDGWPGGTVAVIAAGERWPDGSLRPAVEDLWGAGAVIAALAELLEADPAADGSSATGPAGLVPLSPEAQSAVAAFHAVSDRLPSAMTACGSGRELADIGFAADVAIAAELDASNCVPLLSADRFLNAAG
jgi:2-phosphosulfolactate phosphatase